MNYLFSTVLVLLVVIGAFYAAARLRFYTLRKQRVGLGYPEFQEILGHLAPERAVRSIYDFFESWPLRETPVLPDDNFSEVQGLAGGDVFLELVLLADRCNLHRPSEKQCSDLRTVADVVRLFGELEPKG